MRNQRPSTFTWIYASGAVVLVLVTIFAITFAVQEHNDRILADEITETASELQETGARIASVRDADMKDMNEYIRAFSQMDPLLNDYDRRLQRYTDLYNLARERDSSLLRFEHLYRRSHLTNWENMSEILDITRALSKIMRKLRSSKTWLYYLSRNECSSGMNSSCRSRLRKRLYAPGC